jgi:YD repeat-containing protein
MTVLLGFSCATRERLGLEDLKFPDFERHDIAKNLIDTTFLVSTNWSLKNGPRDTVGIVIYDTAGRIIEDLSNQWESFKYSYDSLGFPQSRFHRNFDIL